MRAVRENKSLALFSFQTGWRILASNLGWSLLRSLVALLLLSACGEERNKVPQAQEEMPAQELMSYVRSQITTQDLELFATGFTNSCPKHPFLSTEKQKDSIAAYATSIAIAESGLNSFLIYPEEELGFASQGLFSLSYVDQRAYECRFSEHEDSHKDREQKSIFQTDHQVDCFFKITRELLSKPSNYPYLRKIAASNSLSPSSLSVQHKLSAYWSVLRESHPKGHKRFYKAFEKLRPQECR